MCIGVFISWKRSVNFQPCSPCLQFSTGKEVISSPVPHVCSFQQARKSFSALFPMSAVFNRLRSFFQPRSPCPSFFNRQRIRQKHAWRTFWCITTKVLSNRTSSPSQAHGTSCTGTTGAAEWRVAMSLTPWWTGIAPGLRSTRTRSSIRALDYRSSESSLFFPIHAASSR